MGCFMSAAFLSNALLLNMAHAETASPLRVEKIATTALKAYSQTKDAGAFIKSLKEQNILFSKETQRFFIENLHEEAPTVSWDGKAFNISFAAQASEEARHFVVEVSGDTDNPQMIINGIALDLKSVTSLYDLKKELISKLSKSSAKQVSVWNKFLNVLYPVAHASHKSEQSWFSKNGGTMVSILGVIGMIFTPKQRVDPYTGEVKANPWFITSAAAAIGGAAWQLGKSSKNHH